MRRAFTVRDWFWLAIAAAAVCWGCDERRRRDAVVEAMTGATYAGGCKTINADGSVFMEEVYMGFDRDAFEKLWPGAAQPSWAGRP